MQCGDAAIAQVDAAVENKRSDRYDRVIRKDTAITRLKTAEPGLRELGVGALYLFGPHARDEAGPDSDIDVFVDPAPGQSLDFSRFMDALDVLRDAVGEKIDYGTRNGLHPLLRQQIEHEAIRVF